MSSGGYRYEGEVNKSNQRHGYGRAFFEGGDEYTGQYANGFRHGRGTYRYANGALYEGQWENGLKNGYGVFTYPDGSKYDGLWLKDERSGYGIYTYSNGHRYEGLWQNHLRHGAGKFVYFNKLLQLKGIWDKGKRVGSGTLESYTAEDQQDFYEKQAQRTPGGSRVTVPGAEGAREHAGRALWWESLNVDGLKVQEKPSA